MSLAEAKADFRQRNAGRTPQEKRISVRNALLCRRILGEGHPACGHENGRSNYRRASESVFGP